MVELLPNRRVNLMTPTARRAARQTNADQVQQDVDAEKQALEERTVQLRAKRLGREKAVS
ncbi:hypothetical protein [Methylobacterium sp. E-046]|uniref:hypothetical protein n=1 Tax=Methylobacterium sp. E-046 TaxID=2836576 RepID=UPI001FB9E76C|nr:hypothetical protein [Methylobacterium sp. E-046]MCJ2101962.1 hypothetical protein [Methylobacterium sp. E-046]